VTRGRESPHRAWIEVDHAALRANLAALRALAGPDREVMAVVKANAYGHGAIAVSSTLVTAGVERLAVATVGEGEALRASGLEVPILVLWRLGAPEAARAVAAGLEATVYDEDGIGLLAQAVEPGTRLGVHLEVDTGLGRQGSAPSVAPALAASIARNPRLALAGTFTHLAMAGEDDAYSEVQLLRFARVLDAMRSGGIDPGLVHVSATGGLLAETSPIGDAVRIGIGLYGLAPEAAVDRDLGLQPVLGLKALPLRIFDLPAGGGVGYGLRFRTERATRIATLGIGYGDGWPRSHGNNGWALVGGRRVPIVGAISMDGLTVDLGPADDVTYGDEFVLIGSQGGARITADEVAAERRTINYEVTTALRERLPRVHLAR
jgi:alanine racemase